MSLPSDLRRPLTATARRIRAQRAMDAGAVLALAGVGIAGVLVAFVKTGALSDAQALPWLIAALSLPVAGALFGALRPVAPLLPAKLLDKAHGLSDRVTNAVAFSAMPERTGFMVAAIEDARAHARSLSAKRAMPLRVPFDVVPALGLAMGVGVLALVEVPRFVEERVRAGSSLVPVVMHEDDLSAFDSELRDLLDDPSTPDDVRGVAREFNRLIEDLADERLDRAESLRRITELEEQLANARPVDARELRESLDQLGQTLERSALADELAEALRQGDAERAEAEMRALAERLREREDVNRAELERLREALARAAEREQADCMADVRRLEQELAQLRQGERAPARTIQRREAELEQRRAECEAHARAEREQELERLLRRQREQQQHTEQERRLLERRRRELDRLRRENEQAMEQRRQLERLQREMQESAESLNQQSEESAAEDLEQGAEELNRMAEQQMSEEEMQRLQQQLAELRELIRRSRQQQQAGGGQQGRQRQGQGQQGQGQEQRMDRFVLRARGQGEGEGTPIQMPGQGGQQGQQQQGQQGQGQGQQGQQGQGGEQQQVLTLGGQGGDAIVEIPGMGGQGRQRGQGMGRAEQGPGAGTGHDDATLDDPTLLGGQRQTVRVEGEQSDEGPVRSDVEINRGAQRGFASRRYREVYTRYEGHAEEVLERDQVPQGYRFYVRRYFQLIRPREP